MGSDVYAAYYPKHSWVLKRELFNIPLLGWGLRMVKPIAVNRGTNSSVAQILREGEEKSRKVYG